MGGFDANFLGAIDKALEILPKNRVQSAQEWLDMMEGKAIPTATGPAAKGPESVKKAVAATGDRLVGFQRRPKRMLAH